MDPTKFMYDEDSTIFSPDGRLFQVEYARETVKKGDTTIGLKFKNGVLLVAYKTMYSNLVEMDSIQKITKIDDNIGCAFIGLSADARHLIDLAQEEAQLHKIWYDEPITVKNLVRNICEYKQLFTTFTGVRPFGVVLFIAGCDPTGIHLFSTDPSGAYTEYKVICEGKKSDEILSYFNKFYKPDISLDEAIKLTINAIKKIIDKKIKKDNLEIVTIEKNKAYNKIDNKDIKL
ncbi:MAG: archaeal proteasome endopeptidase complex subunit alpha [Candidatus Thermoplasmatota archaeon]|jgi:proteasome alpha subunit|nr:archaeal proteasome endopeptidase complex subunit alpha [Candidatus Thermoplasmatota archaeon]